MRSYVPVLYIYVSLIPTRLHTWQHVTTVHAQIYRYEMCAWNMNITTRDWTVCIQTRTPHEQVTWQHVADSICTRGRNTVSARDCTDYVLHMTMCTGLYTCVLDCVYVFTFTSGHHSCCTDLAITSREHYRQLSDLWYFETNALFTLSTHKLASFIHSTRSL